MKFYDVLKEYVDAVPLSTWNRKQFDLWKKLLKDKYVEENDTDAFVKFATNFDAFYRKYNTFPSKKEAYNFIK